MERRRHERIPTASIPVQVSDVDGELVDLSQSGAAVVHRSPINAGSNCTLVFPSYTGFYIPCQVLRSVVQVHESDRGTEYVFRSAITFANMSKEEKEPLEDFLELQINRLDELKRKIAEEEKRIEEETDPFKEGAENDPFASEDAEEPAGE
ncbi:MAG: PilZ domain-containing protein [Thermoanaerobaculia bacterium]|nr:PilZ domain-containing protein [Thermoanaerobaculia bacterium]